MTDAMENNLVKYDVALRLHTTKLQQIKSEKDGSGGCSYLRPSSQTTTAFLTLSSVVVTVVAGDLTDDSDVPDL